MTKDFLIGDTIRNCDRPEKEPMHPDDYQALLAWITAKRFHEFRIENPFPEQVVYYRTLG